MFQTFRDIDPTRKLQGRGWEDETRLDDSFNYTIFLVNSDDNFKARDVFCQIIYIPLVLMNCDEGHPIQKRNKKILINDNRAN